MIKKYYFDNTDLDKRYSTIWYGELLYKGDKISISVNYFQESNRDLDDLFIENLNINFYVTLIDNIIHISCCSDSSFYYYDFEKKIKKTITDIEKYFNIDIYSGNFNANELKYNPNQYKYIISKNKENKIILRKKILNWDLYDSKKKKITDNILDNFENLNI